MVETTNDPSAEAANPSEEAAKAAPGTDGGGAAPAPAGEGAPASAGEGAPASAGEGAPASAPLELSVRALLEAGVHFGHQTRRWNPRMKPYIYGERNGIHIIDLDQTLALFREALDFVRETAASGGRLLMVGTKRQAQAAVETEASRAGQYYVARRWLGGTLTNFRTVKRSIERYISLEQTLGDEEKLSELTKRERARLGREVEKYAKSLSGLKEMSRLPAAIFIVDLNREHIAVSEARRLGIPIVAVVDTNCDPEGIDFVIPGNDDALRALNLYCRCIADTCVEGAAVYDERIRSEVSAEEVRPAAQEAAAPARRVVEITQPPRRARAAGGREDERPGGTRRRSGRSGAGAPRREPSAAGGEPGAKGEGADASAETKPEGGGS